MDKKLIGLDLSHIADYLKEQLAEQKHITVLA